MIVPIETLIDGIVRTLTEAVLPDVPTRFARGQLYAVIDVLQNLRDRVEVKAELLEARAASAASALERVVASLRERAPAEATRIDAARAAVPAVPPAARAAALDAALVTALEAIDALAPELAAPARAAIAEHLAAQAMRDLAVLKPSLLAEISKG
jgi:hypothetical protein